MSRYDKAERDFTSPEEKRDGIITAAETRLQYADGRRDSEYVKDISCLSDDDFERLQHYSSYDAGLLYCYNKYPEFFIKWDNGIYDNDKKFYDQLALNGWITDAEIEKAGGVDVFIADAKSMITEERDRRSFAKYFRTDNKLLKATVRAALSKTSECCKKPKPAPKPKFGHGYSSPDRMER